VVGAGAPHHTASSRQAKSHRHRRRSEPGAAFAANGLTRKRTVALLVVMALGFSAVVVRLTQVQAVSASTYAEKGANQRVRRIVLAAERGAMFDRRGIDLALSVSQLTVWANPRVVSDARVKEYAAELAPVLGVDEQLLVARLSKDKAAFVYLARKVDERTAEAVRKLDLPGVGFLPESKRFYPSGPLAGPVLGSVGLDNLGLSGLEVAYEKTLAGKPGEIVVEQDPSGREIPQGRESYRPSVRGHDLVLTLDQSLQYEVEQALVGARRRGIG
jgi:stage V sporulation protein D (sporulation-specific penicillin-binding protein)